MAFGECHGGCRGHACGASLCSPYAKGIVTGRAHYILDVPPMEGMLRLKVLRSPYPCARIKSIKRDSALAVPGETDRIESIWKETSDVMFGSYGIDQCLDLVEEALKSGRDCPSPKATRGWKAPVLLWPCLNRGRRPSIAPAPRCGSWQTVATGLPPARPRWAMARPRRIARSRPQHAPATSPSSSATPTRRPMTPAPSRTPAPSSPAKPSRRPRARSATSFSTVRAGSSAATRATAACRTTPSSAPTGKFR